MNIVNVTISATPRSILRISICNFNLLVFEPHVCVQTNVCTMATSWLSIPGHRPSLFLFRSFCPFFLSFSVCFLYRLLRIYFRFSAFLRGGFCYSAISSRRYTPPALVASLKYAYSPCVLSSVFFLSCVADVDLSSFFFFSSFPFSISIWTSFVFILYFSCGHYAVSSVSVSAATRLSHDIYTYIVIFV